MLTWRHLIMNDLPYSTSNMTHEQFEVIAQLIRSREPATTAARLVLMDGLSNAEAATETGISPQSVSNTLARFRLADKKIRAAYRGDQYLE